MAHPLPTTQPRLLYRLQQIDTQIEQVEERLRTLDRGEQFREMLGAAEAEQTSAERDLAAKQSRMRTLELELQSTVAKRRRVEDEMYSGRVGNPKELAAMQEDVGQLERQAGHLEEEILGLMEDVEALLERVRISRDGTAMARINLNTRVAVGAGEEQELQSLLTRLRGERQEVAGELDEAMLRRYDRLRDRIGPVAVAAVRRGICDGCHVAIPEARVRTLREEPDVLLTCERCGRILVLPDA